MGITTSGQGQRTTELSGTAVFHQDKLIDFLNGEDSKYYLFAVGKVKGGLLVQPEDSMDTPLKVTLEIVKDHTYTKVKPVYSNGELAMTLDIYVNASIGEIGGSKNIIGEPELGEFRKDVEESLKANVLRVIEKVQQQDDSDIFGFGSSVKREMPQIWRGIEEDWDSIFKDLAIDVNVHLSLTNSGLVSKSLEVGD